MENIYLAYFSFYNQQNIHIEIYFRYLQIFKSKNNTRKMCLAQLINLRINSNFFSHIHTEIIYIKFIEFQFRSIKE